MDVDQDLDKYIELIGKDFILDSLVTNQNSSIKILEAQMQNLIL